jgi:hypothetical protein
VIVTFKRSIRAYPLAWQVLRRIRGTVAARADWRRRRATLPRTPRRARLHRRMLPHLAGRRRCGRSDRCRVGRRPVRQHMLGDRGSGGPDDSEHCEGEKESHERLLVLISLRDSRRADAEFIDTPRPRMPGICILSRRKSPRRQSRFRRMPLSRSACRRILASLEFTVGRRERM